MEFIYAVILGVIEGFTEFLPISSTGHLILAERLLHLPPTDFWKSFTVAIQLGAILAVLALYGRKLLLHKIIFIRVLVAFLPTAFIGLVLYSLIKQYLLGSAMVVIYALVLGGVAIILFEKYHRASAGAIDRLENISYQKAFLIGLAQSLAVIPGVSRAATTIIGGLALGLSRRTIVEFSFLLAIPTMVAATGLDLIKTGLHFSGFQWTVLMVGFIVSFLAALAAVRWLLRYVSSHDFMIFGWYRLVVAAVGWWLLF